MEETTYYSDETGIRVTNTRVIIGDSTYALANITSVRKNITKPSRTGPIALGLIGLAIAVSGDGHWGMILVGVFLIAVSAIMWRGMNPTYHLQIVSSAGETRALESQDKDRIDKVIHAINEAIIHRG